MHRTRSIPLLTEKAGISSSWRLTIISWSTVAEASQQPLQLSLQQPSSEAEIPLVLTS